MTQSGKDVTPFLGRWATRKQHAREQAAAPARESAERPDSKPPAHLHHPPIDQRVGNQTGSPMDSPELALASPEDSGMPETSGELQQVVEDVAVLGDADMPPVETLTSDSDLSAFFSKGVSATLRRAALRHVFMQPEYNVRDGLNDYDGDYTSFQPLGDIVTSDMKFHAARKERDRLAAEREAEMLAEQEAVVEAEQHTDRENEAVPNTETGPGTEPGEESEAGQAAELHTDQLPDREPDSIVATADTEDQHPGAGTRHVRDQRDLVPGINSVKLHKRQ